VVFLDPTFNHRPEFEPLLDALIRENASRALTLFAEVRAEGLSAEQAGKLKQAGFDRLEIGLQSVNRETLKRVRRGGSPEKVAEAARMLHGEGIELLVDLIVGLPGDTPDDVLRGMEFLDANVLRRKPSVPLSLLPGTPCAPAPSRMGCSSIRPTLPGAANRDVQRDALLQTLLAAEERLGRRLDEWPGRTWPAPPRGVRFTGALGPARSALVQRKDLFARRAESCGPSTRGCASTHTPCSTSCSVPRSPFHSICSTSSAPASRTRPELRIARAGAQG